MKNILIVGANSYIGESFKEYMNPYFNDYKIDVIESKGLHPYWKMFRTYHTVLCVVGIAHVKESRKNRQLFFDINRDFVISIAKEAKIAGVNQFILLSSMSVYGIQTGVIGKDSIPKPTSAYGLSKLQADEEIHKLQDSSFVFTCLRPPMVYGYNCPGNYQLLRKLTLHIPIFPRVDNIRSMIYIGNLCEYIKQCVDNEKGGLFFPQNSEYVNTSAMVELIAKTNKKKIKQVKWLNKVIKSIPLNIFKKVFGDLVYTKTDLVDKYSFEDSIILSESS